MKKIRNHTGITLIALVITIIILLILAGISIFALTGENGLLKKAETAKRNTQISAYEEEIKLEIADELAERNYQEKEEVLIVSLQKRLEKKDWKKQIIISDENMVEQIEKEKNTRITIDTIEDYQIIINVDNFKNIATIKNSINMEETEGTISKQEYDKLLEAYHQLESNYNNATSSIASALNDIGIETNSSDTISSLAEKIKNIKTNSRITKLAINGVGYQYSNIYHFNITEYENYKNLTLDNLSIQLNRSPFRDTQQGDMCGCIYYTYTYNPENGIITVTLTGTVNHQSWNDPSPTATITIIE